MGIIEGKILNFLQNKSTLAETEEVIQFFNKTGDESEIRNILGSIWQNNDIQISSESIDLDSVLDKIHQQVGLLHSSEINTNKKALYNKVIHYISKAAAILFLPLLITTIWSLSRPSSGINQDQITWVVLTTPMGAKMNFELPDGSKVWLNDGSRIKYPTHFTGNQREVFLDGEAFFKVAKNEKLPFIVKNKNATVKVTGTSFNFRAYPDDQLFETTLNTGVIELEIPKIGAKAAHKIPMKPSEQICLNTQTGEFQSKNVDAETYNSWINGKLLFRDAPLDEVMRKLERWYNADIVIDSPELKNILITATFQEEKLSQAMELLSFATPIKYKISNRKRKEDGTYTKQLILISKR